jgi:hypothetical protein
LNIEILRDQSEKYHSTKIGIEVLEELLKCR